MIRTFFKYLETTGWLHSVYALLIEAIVLLLLSFAAFFTLETILPGLISGRFVIGEIIIGITLIFFFAAFLGRSLRISFPIVISKSLRATVIIGILWILGILVISLLSFPLWSILLSLIAFAAIGYLFWKELGK